MRRARSVLSAAGTSASSTGSFREFWRGRQVITCATPRHVVTSVNGVVYVAIRYRGAISQKLLSIVGASALVFTACAALSPVVSFRSTGSGTTSAVTSSQPSTSRRTPDESALQVTFEPGTRSTLLEGTLDAGKEAQFVVSADAGSVLMASVVGSSADVTAAVYRIDTGEEIPDAVPDQSFWIARVPETVGYLIVLQSRGEATGFSLTVGTPSESLLDMLQFSTAVASLGTRKEVA